MPEWLLNLLELVCVAVFVAGIAMIYVPAALIVAGTLGVIAFEYLDRRMKVNQMKAGQ